MPADWILEGKYRYIYGMYANSADMGLGEAVIQQDNIASKDENGQLVGLLTAPPLSPFRPHTVEIHG
jgi:hypothetical protein